MAPKLLQKNYTYLADSKFRANLRRYLRVLIMENVLYIKVFNLELNNETLNTYMQLLAVELCTQEVKVSPWYI